MSLYRSPSQSQDAFATFLNNFELNLEYIYNKNPDLIIIVGDFTVKSKT